MNVFVYGTLKPGEKNYPYYCEGKALAAREAYTSGKLFHLNALGYPAMTLTDEENETNPLSIQGILLTFADDSSLTDLDQLEDYDPQRNPSENEYQRQKIKVYDGSRKPLGEAWGYIMTPEKVKQFQGVFLPSGYWSEKIDTLAANCYPM